MWVLVVLLGLSDLLLATVVFILLARPSSGLGLAAWLSGESDEWQQGTLSPQRTARLTRTVTLLGRGGLLLLLIWGFVVGALVTWLRL